MNVTNPFGLLLRRICDQNDAIIRIVAQLVRSGWVGTRSSQRGRDRRDNWDAGLQINDPHPAKSVSGPNLGLGLPSPFPLRFPLPILVDAQHPILLGAV